MTTDSVARETRLSGFARLLLRWNTHVNLVGPAVSQDGLEPAFTEARALAAQVQGPRCTDFGSGGGLPAIPLAILRPDLHVLLVESDKRKAAFLRAAIRELGLANAALCVERIEAMTPARADTVTARAFAPLRRLFAYAHPHLAPGGRLALLKGRNVHSEIDEASTDWHFDHEIVPIPDQPGIVLNVSNLRPAA